MSTYQFKYHDPHQYEGLSPDQLLRLEYIDRLLDDKLVDHDPSYLQSQTDEELAMLVSMLPKPRPVAPAQVAPAKPARWVNPYPVVKYRAQVWINGANVNLGSFLSEQVRDEVVAMAKSMRSLGLPIEAIRESVQRMSK